MASGQVNTDWREMLWISDGQILSRNLFHPQSLITHQSLRYTSPFYSDYNRNFVSLEWLLQQPFFTGVRIPLGLIPFGGLGSVRWSHCFCVLPQTLTRILAEDLFDFSEPASLWAAHMNRESGGGVFWGWWDRWFWEAGRHPHVYLTIICHRDKGVRSQLHIWLWDFKKLLSQLQPKVKRCLARKSQIWIRKNDLFYFSPMSLVVGILTWKPWWVIKIARLAQRPQEDSS